MTTSFIRNRWSILTMNLSTVWWKNVPLNMRLIRSSHHFSPMLIRLRIARCRWMKFNNRQRFVIRADRCWSIDDLQTYWNSVDHFSIGERNFAIKIIGFIVNRKPFRFLLVESLVLRKRFEFDLNFLWKWKNRCAAIVRRKIRRNDLPW